MREENTLKVQTMMLNNNIVLPDEDYDIIDDIFKDNVINNVKVYTKSQIDDFKKDVVLYNIKELDINKNHRGKVQWSSTLVGEINYGINDVEVLINGPETIAELNNQSFETEMNPEETIITVIGEVEWDTNGIEDTRQTVMESKTLFIYVPVEVSADE